MRYLSEQAVAEKFNVSRQSVWRWRKERGFPKAVYIGGNTKPLWIEEEVDVWTEKNSERAA